MRPFKAGRTILRCEVIVLNQKDTKIVDQTILGSYIYDLGRGKSAIALGFGSLFNHNVNANVDYEIEIRNNRIMIKYTANRSILPGEQLFINYGYNP